MLRESRSTFFKRQPLPPPQHSDAALKFKVINPNLASFGETYFASKLKADGNIYLAVPTGNGNTHAIPFKKEDIERCS